MSMLNYLRLIPPDPSITAFVSESGVTPIIGIIYSLTCTVSGVERLTNATITYRWLKDGGLLSNQTNETLSFASLSFFDVGVYSCEVTVMSSFISNPITTHSTTSINITLKCKLLSCSSTKS